MSGFFGGAIAASRLTGLTAVFESILSEGGGVLTTGIKTDLRVPFACTITKVSLFADVAGSIVLDFWVDTYANYPPTVTDTITASAKPTLSAVNKNEDSTLTGWIKPIAAGSLLRINVDSVATVTRVLVVIEVTRT